MGVRMRPGLFHFNHCLFLPSLNDSWLKRIITGDTFESNPQLASQLKEEGVHILVVFGIQSECCVRSTIKGALATGFRVTLLRGAHSTYDTVDKTAREIEAEVEHELKAEGVEVVAWEEWQPSA
jgi:nicotinamidase-related amidase